MRALRGQLSSRTEVRVGLRNPSRYANRPRSQRTLIEKIAVYSERPSPGCLSALEPIPPNGQIER